MKLTYSQTDASRPRRPGQGILLLLTIILAAAALYAGAEAEPTKRPADLARDAFVGAAGQTVQPETAAAVTALRAYGQLGVDALRAAEPAGGTAEHDAWRTALDRVCAQRDCWASGLFWHTDFDDAVAEARRSHRPILSLRLLGRLDEDVSCANSRFFRTVLYADPSVAAILRDEFVLHWSSERPVPKVTVDFGDGRKLEGTVTGNSIHYVLDSRGRVVDAMPGLYGPGLFQRRLRELAPLARSLGRTDPTSFLAARKRHHDEMILLRSRETRLASSLEVGPGGTLYSAQTLYLAQTAGRPARGRPDARAAGELSISKMMSETRMLDAMTPRNGAGDIALLSAELEELEGKTATPRLTAGPADKDLRVLARLRPDDWRLSPDSRRFLEQAHAEYLRSLPGLGDGPEVLAAAFETFQQSVALDTVRNEYVLHPAIHRRLARSFDVEPGIERLNRWVYDELFLTPADDPWLGLVQPDVYAALHPNAASATVAAPDTVVAGAMLGRE